jgi:hypothetical protein
MRKTIVSLSAVALICAMAVNAFAVDVMFHCGDKMVGKDIAGVSAEFINGEWVLFGEYECPICGQTEWFSYSNNGNGNGGNVQFRHNRPVVEEELICVYFVGFTYDRDGYGPYFGNPEGENFYLASADAPLDWDFVAAFYGDDIFDAVDFWMPGTGSAFDSFDDAPLTDYAVVNADGVVYVVGILTDSVDAVDASAVVDGKIVTVTVTETWKSGKTVAIELIDERGNSASNTTLYYTVGGYEVTVVIPPNGPATATVTNF